ncbi:uncharacterized protein LOC136062337 [Quercus suber]|uniref:uncharacterized protein LOC136062337 n=1 Tax=Quercus suber TaxID=58331 RepID=UPI0032DF4C94
MAGNPDRRNRNLYCQYHQDHGHTIEDCRNLWIHLEQLVSKGKLVSKGELRHLLHHTSGRGGPISVDSQRDDPLKRSLGTINGPKKCKLDDQLVLGFSDADKVGTVQPHDDALVVTLRIGGYDVKRVMVDQGSAAEIMYPDLYRGLNLKLSDLTPYHSSLISFEGRVITPKGQIRLPVQTGSEVVEVDFIVVDVFSPYTAIIARPWLHALGAVSSTLHQKIKYPSEGRVCEIRGDQSVARQCLVAAIQHELGAESSTRGL